MHKQLDYRSRVLPKPGQATLSKLECQAGPWPRACCPSCPVCLFSPPGNQHSISALFSNTLLRRNLTRQFISKFPDKLQISRMSVAAAQFPSLAQRPIAGTICLFDVDDTLTPARRVRTRLVFFFSFFKLRISGGPQDTSRRIKVGIKS